MRAGQRPEFRSQASPGPAIPRSRATAPVAATLLAVLVAALLGGAALAQAMTPTVQVRYDASLGYYLTDGAGMTLYTFSNDSAGKSACTGGCAQAWPPLAADTAAATPLNVPGSFSVITRDDGSKQVAYNGKPLYTFKADQKPGDTAGQGSHDVWWVANVEPAIQTLATAGGTLLVGPTGMTLYTFGKDPQGGTACTGKCALNWPPLVGGYDPAHGNMPTVAKDVKGTVGVFARPDGSMQLTLNGKALYYFRGDGSPGQTTGDGLLGEWQKATQP